MATKAAFEFTANSVLVFPCAQPEGCTVNPKIVPASTRSTCMVRVQNSFLGWRSILSTAWRQHSNHMHNWTRFAFMVRVISLLLCSGELVGCPSIPSPEPSNQYMFWPQEMTERMIVAILRCFVFCLCLINLVPAFKKCDRVDECSCSTDKGIINLWKLAGTYEPR